MAKRKTKKPKKYLFEYNLLFVNILSFFILLIVMLITYFIELNTHGGFLEDLGLLLIELSGESGFDLNAIAVLFVAVIVMFLWLGIHELIHGLFYRFGGAKKEDVTYGVALEKGILFCKCSNYVNKKTILMSVIAPFIIIGVVTYVIGIILNLEFLVFLSILNICGAAGDLAMFFFFIGRDKDLRFKELGDSTTFCLETTEDLVGKKFIAVKLKKVIASEKELKEEKNKKITVTKESWAVIIVVAIVFIISLLSIFIK